MLKVLTKQITVKYVHLHISEMDIVLQIFIPYTRNVVQYIKEINKIHQTKCLFSDPKVVRCYMPYDKNI